MLSINLQLYFLKNYDIKHNMDNTTYEFFIRRCWDCERLKHGANTDIWEDLLTKHYDLQKANVGNFIRTQKEFDKKLAQVKNYLDKAYNKLIVTANKKKINPETIALLSESRALVARSSAPREISDVLKEVFVLMNATAL